MSTPPTVDVHLHPADLRATLLADVATGLSADPKWLPSKWFYDETGSRLFEEITRLPEYYPTRRERSILAAHAVEMAALAAPATLVELGSGTSEKTRLLLDALVAGGTLRRFVPFDVSEATLREACDVLGEAYPSLEIHGIVGDFDRHLHTLPTGDRRMVVFLGGTIGNFAPAQRACFYSALAEGMATGDTLLLGMDLVKDPKRLVAAYDDTAGVTAAFNRNILSVLNAELGAGFAPERFDHVACWDPEAEWIEMRLRSTVAQDVDLGALERTIHLAAGEEIRTEISAKFRADGVEAELAAAGLETLRRWTDPDVDFAVALARLP